MNYVILDLNNKMETNKFMNKTLKTFRRIFPIIEITNCKIRKYLSYLKTAINTKKS